MNIKNLSETILKLDSELKQIDDRRINLTQKIWSR